MQDAYRLQHDLAGYDNIYPDCPGDTPLNLGFY